jgi:hypothetical protein
MMSVHFWGESVTGRDGSSGWKLVVRNGGDREAVLLGWSITFFGTEDDPQPGVPIEAGPELVKVSLPEPDTVDERPETGGVKEKIDETGDYIFPPLQKKFG